MTRVATVPAPRPASAWSMDGSPKRLGCAEMFEVIVFFWKLINVMEKSIRSE